MPDVTGGGIKSTDASTDTAEEATAATEATNATAEDTASAVDEGVGQRVN